MALPTIQLTVNITDQSGAAVAGAVVYAQLNQPDLYQGQYIEPLKQRVVADGSGNAVLTLFPNALGSAPYGATYYNIQAWNADESKRVFATTAFLPNSNTNLSAVFGTLPAPAPADLPITPNVLPIIFGGTGSNSVAGAQANLQLPALIAAGILALGIGTLAFQNANAVTISGGSINATTIGATTPSTGRFTQLSITSAVGKIIPGATSISFRNNADSQDNLLISDAGVVTIRSNLAIGGNTITGPSAASLFVQAQSSQSVFIQTGAPGGPANQGEFRHVASTTNYLVFRGSNGAAPILDTNGGDLIIKAAGTTAITVLNATGAVTFANGIINLGGGASNNIIAASSDVDIGLGQAGVAKWKITNNAGGNSWVPVIDNGSDVGSPTGPLRIRSLYAGTSVVCSTVGGPTGQTVSFTADGLIKWNIAVAGHSYPNTDNTFDIGISGTNRIRTLYVGTSIVNGDNNLARTSTSLLNNAAANTATLTNAPTAGNPTKWIPINDNGTTRNIPAW